MDVSDQGNKTCNDSGKRKSFYLFQRIQRQVWPEQSKHGDKQQHDSGKGQIRQSVLGHGAELNFNLSAKANTVRGRS